MDNPLLILGPALLAALVSYLVTPYVRRLALKVGAVDLPGPRKVHAVPMPRLGGPAVIIAAGLGLVVAQAAGLLAASHKAALWQGLALGLIPIVVVSAWDDIATLGPWPKFAAQTLGAAVAVWFGVALAPTVHLFGHAVQIGWAGVPISMLWLVGVTNAFNIVDGLDGLSAGLALIAAGSLSAVFFLVHQTDMAVASMVLAGALIGFLPYNAYPARIFLGDTGSTAVGFCLGCFALRGGSTLSAGFATLLPVVMVGLPVAETLVSMARRAVLKLRGKDRAGVFRADRNHFHHRLLALGMSHRNAVLLLYAAGLLLAVGGLASVLMTARQAAFLLIGLLVAGLLGLARLGYEEFAVIRSGLVLKFYEAPVLKRSMFIVFVDLMLVAAGVYGAIVLKYGVLTLQSHVRVAVDMLGALAPLTVLFFWLGGLYRGSWKLAGIDDFMRVCRAVVGASFAAFLVTEIVFRDSAPISLFAVYALLQLMMTNGARLSYRALIWSRWWAANDGEPTLIYGAGEGGASALRELLSNREVGMRPIGFIDDDPRKLKTRVNGRPVLGSIDDMERVIGETGALVVVVSSQRIGPERLAIARSICRLAGVRLVTMEIRFEDSSEPERQMPRAVLTGYPPVKKRAVF